MTMTQKERLSQLVKRYAGFLYAIVGVLSAMSFVLGQEGYKGASDLPASSTSYLWGALAVCFGLLFWQVYSRMKIRLSRGQVLVGLLFGLVNILGTMLFAYDSWAMLKKPVTLLFTLLKGLGQSLPMMAAFGWLSHLLENGACTRSPLAAQSINDAAGKPAGWVKRLLNWSRRHEGLALWLLFCLCWLPYVLVFYPGTVCWDLGEAAQMFFGLRPMNAWHGVLATWLFGSCIWFGRLFGNDNLGILLYVLMQLFLLAYMAAQMLTFLRRRGLNRRFRLLVLAFFALTPVWGAYVQFVGKDTLYVAALGLFLVRCAEVLLAREAATVRPITFWFCMEIFLCGLLSSTIRPNGLIVVLPMAVLMLLSGFTGDASVWRIFRRNTAICALSAAVAAIMFSYVLVPGLGIGDDTGSSLYSPMFQQSARTLRDHSDSVTAEEYAAIDHVLNGANLPDLYEPWISDPVKYTFRYFGQPAEIQQEALIPYRQAWLSMFKKYPLTYTEAFFAGNVSYYCFTPKMGTGTYNNQAGSRLIFENYINQMGDDPRLVHVYQPVPESIRSLTALYARGWRHIPVLGLLFSCATYTWVLIGAALSLVRQKRRLVLCLFVPALLSLIVCCVSPVNDYFRYFLPIVAMTPLLLGVAVKPQKEEQG
ncbi:MAG: hypothetical protein IKC28_09210 [Clostridia bacterium]|nr:hypothetical protein [Clostridia bacterium]